MDTAVDIRLDFLCEYLLRTFNQKTEKWSKFMSSDKKHLLFRFFDSSTDPVIFFCINIAGKLSCSLTFPTNYKSKLVHCLRNTDEKITMNNFHKIISMCEMSPNVLTDMCLLSNEVFCPMLCNPQNQKGWPKIIKHDIMKHVDDLRTLMHLAKGDMTNEVMLLMPKGLENFDCETSCLEELKGVNVDMQLKTNIEGTVIKWARQIYDLLQQDSHTALKHCKFPLPLDDINFYQQRLANMESIYLQLRDPRVQRMAQFLEDTKSVYLGCFKTMLINVVAAIVECRDICVYQRPLVKHFKDFEETDIFKAKPLMKPMLHCVGLLWAQCRYFCHIDKLMALLEKMCNLMIQQCTNAIETASIFQGKPDEKLVKTTKALATLKYFIQSFELVRKKVPSLFTPGMRPVRWSFDFERVFVRLNTFIERLHMIEDILSAALEIFSLAKVEFSGQRGRILSNECLKIQENYLLVYQNLGNISYDPADPEDHNFYVDYDYHMNYLMDIDNQLASLFIQGLDECHNLEEIFKFCNVIGNLFHRPIIKLELQPKLLKLIDLMIANLDAVKKIFNEEMQEVKMNNGLANCEVDPHLPPVAAVLLWVRQLRQRITLPMEEFLKIEDEIIEIKSVTHVKKKNEEILGYLNALEEKIFNAWSRTVPKICKTYLAKNLIIRSPLFVRNNLSQELMTLLREIKYMNHLGKKGIPSEGLELFNRNEKLQHNVSYLNRVIDWYNDIREDSHETEVALIEKEINLIDNLLNRGIEQLTWNDDFTEWIAEVYAATNALQQRVLTAQNNLRRGLANITAWADEPLYNPEQLELLDINKRHTKLVSRRDKILQSYAEFQDILEDNFKLFFNVKNEDDEKEKKVTLEEAVDATVDYEVKAMHFSKLHEIEKWRIQNQLEAEERQRINMQSEAVKRVCRKACRLNRVAKMKEHPGEEVNATVMNKEAISEPAGQGEIGVERYEVDEEFFVERWPKYVKYVDGLVSAQIMKAIKVNLELFQLESNVEMGPGVPVVKVTAELRDPDIHFSPSLDINVPDGLYNMFKEMIKDIFMQAKFFPRINPEVVSLSSYEDIANEDAIINLYNEILRRLERTIADIIGYASKYEMYAPLWHKDRQEVLQVFLKYGKYMTPEEIAQYRSENGIEPPKRKPTLENYQKEIEKFIAMFEEVDALPTSYLANGWLNLDLKMLNQSIMNIICKWSNLYKMDLKEQVHASLDNLEKFIDNASKELAVEVLEGDYDGLLRVMSVLNDVRTKVDDGIDQVFKPIWDAIDVFKEYEVELSEETYEQLDRLPEKWHGLVKQATIMKYTVAPLQAARASLIVKRCSQVSQRLAQYREQFRNNEIFLISCKEPYKQMDQMHRELMDLESNIQLLKHSCSLFEVQMPDEKNLTACRRDMKLIKQVWDYYFLVMGTIEFWKTTPWKKMDITVINEDCKRFAKDLRKFDKDVRSWQPYVTLDTAIKNLMTFLRAVIDQDPVLKDAQRFELMEATKAVHSHLMSIDTPHVSSTPSLSRQPSNISVEDIISDFKSLDDLAATTESENSKCMNGKTDSIDILKSNYKKYLHLQDYRRLKSFENHLCGIKLTKKLNRSYSLQEMKEHGLQLQPSQKNPCHQKSVNQALILSEFIL